MEASEQAILSMWERMDKTQREQLLEAAQQIVAPPRTYTALELLDLPDEERERYIAWSFAQGAKMEFEIFESYSDEEIDGFEHAYEQEE